MANAAAWRKRGFEIAKIPLEPMEVSQQRLENYKKFLKNHKIKERNDRERQKECQRLGIDIRDIKGKEYKRIIKEIGVEFDILFKREMLPPFGDKNALSIWFFVMQGEAKGYTKSQCFWGLCEADNITDNLREKYGVLCKNDSIKRTLMGEHNRKILWKWFVNHYGEEKSRDIVSRMSKVMGNTFMKEKFLLKEFVNK